MKQTSVLIMILTVVLMLASPAFAYEFHIVPEVDQLSGADAESYIGSAVSSVTRNLGAPSMVRGNLSEADQIDYIYVGASKVFTFVVMREGKQVMASFEDARSNWENGIFPAYPV